MVVFLPRYEDGQVKEDEIGGARGTSGVGGKCMQGFGE